ncbi:ABC transporter permease [Termitidicoccus mucosus]|uniref:ABC-2 type transporter transmembrane domain-containing protein n=1 Tax=Termitidicoccus mucosus TaxID=1184151 RepID=A0A178INT9_9BACT|nr:hypothetical protein AW736_06480 [Opitutaceae bacterium TSB47]
MTLLEGIRSGFRDIFTSKTVVSTLVLGVVVYSFFYPAGYDRQVAMRLPVAIVDLDNTTQSRAIVRAAAAVRGIEVAARPADFAEARALLRRNAVNGILLIPADFQRNALGGRKGTLALYSNNAYLVRNAAVLGALAAVVQDAAARIMREEANKAGVLAPALANLAMPVEVVMRPLYNTREGYASYAVAAAAQIIIHQTLLIGAAMLVAIRRQRHAAQGLAGRPALSAGEFWGLVLALVTVCSLTSLYFNGLAFWFQDYPRGHNVPGLIFLTLVYIFAVAGLGLFAGSFFKTPERAMCVLACTSLPFFFLAGYAWPAQLIPSILHWAGLLVPSTTGLPAYVKINQFGASLHEIRSELLILGTAAVAYLGLAWWRLGKGEPGPRAAS